jgi:hypothetical protein
MRGGIASPFPFSGLLFLMMCTWGIRGYLLILHMSSQLSVDGQSFSEMGFTYNVSNIESQYFNVDFNLVFNQVKRR